MVERAAVNRDVVGSSPTSGANFSKETGGSQVSDSVPKQKANENSDSEMSKWPKKLNNRNEVLAKVSPA